MIFCYDYYSVMIPLILLLSCSVTSVDPEAGGTVQRLMSQQESLIQPGLSFINSSNLAGISRVSRVTLNDIHNVTMACSSISTTINPVFLIYHLTPNIAKITNTREAQTTSSFFIIVDSELKFSFQEFKNIWRIFVTFCSILGFLQF